MLYTALHLKDIRECDRTSGLLTLEQIAATQMLHYVDWIQTMMQTTFKFFPCPCCLLPIWIQTIPNPSIFARPPPRNTVCWMSFQSQWKITPQKNKGATKNDFSLATVNPWYESLLDMLSSTDVSCLTWINFSFCATLYWSPLPPISFIFWDNKNLLTLQEVFPPKLWPRRGVASPAHQVQSHGRWEKKGDEWFLWFIWVF